MKARILVLDDDGIMLQMLAVILRSDGYLVDVAQHAEIAIKKLATNQYDLLILDVMLPDISGITMVESIRQGKYGDHLASLQILFCTAGGQDIAMDDLGPDNVISKPLLSTTLLTAVSQLLASSKKHVIKREDPK